MNLKSIKDLSASELKGRKVVARLDFNVPISGGHIADDFRIKKALPTLDYLTRHGSKIIILSHLEDVYSKDGGASSLRPVFEYLKDMYEIDFATSVEDASVKAAALAEGNILLVENLRFNKGEKANDPEFAAKLAALGDIYLNECFSVSHRNHASVVGVPQILPGYVGPLFLSEVENLSKALSPEHPFIFILGGAKFETKLPLIEKFLKLADQVVVVGALANDFFKAKGFETGSSSVYGKIDISHLLNDPKIILPIDVGVWTQEGSVDRSPEDVRPSDNIQDIGPESLEFLKPYIESAKFILWNGPLGNYEKGFRDRTVKLAEIIAGAEGFSIVGGGDTTAAISHLKIEDKFGFVSTGGGAMLEFLEKGTLPGIEALTIKE